MSKQSQEIWESTTGGTTYVHVKDTRNPGGWVQKKVGGRGTQRITLTVEEREFNQELVAWENEPHDPFRNGLLVRVSPKDVDRGEHELTDEDLIAVLQLSSDDVFQIEVTGIESEVILRRLLGLAKANTTMTRYELLQQIVDERYHVGKTQRVVKELIEDDRRYADADL